MQQPSEEKWEVAVGKDKHILNGLEIQAIKKAQTQGQNIVWFKDLCINTNFIASMRLLNPYKPTQLADPESKPLTEQQRAAGRVKINEIRTKLLKKMSV